MTRWWCVVVFAVSCVTPTRHASGRVTCEGADGATMATGTFAAVAFIGAVTALSDDHQVSSESSAGPDFAPLVNGGLLMLGATALTIATMVNSGAASTCHRQAAASDTPRARAFERQQAQKHATLETCRLERQRAFETAMAMTEITQRDDLMAAVPTCPGTAADRAWAAIVQAAVLAVRDECDAALEQARVAYELDASVYSGSMEVEPDLRRCRTLARRACNELRRERLSATGSAVAGRSSDCDRVP